jgi:hypothetical protein
MNARSLRLLAVVVAAGLAVAALVWWRGGPEETAAPGTSQPAAAPAGASPSRAAPTPQAAAPAPPAAPAAPAPNGKTFPTEPGPSPDAPKPAFAYRPASLLRFSSGEPAASAGDDASHPTLRRLIALVSADSAQQAQMRELWKAHEDGRRALWAVAYPRTSGPRLLDRVKLRELDDAFRAGLTGLLRPDQLEKFVSEVIPSTEEPQVQEVWGIGDTPPKPAGRQ